MLAHPEPERRPVSLRIRLLLLAVLVLAISLGLVGLALNSAYSRSSETDLHNQMETWAYLVLGATEISEDGNIRVQDDIGDPRLSQPSSGVYVHVHGDAEEWNSPSSLGVDLPELATIASGENQFVATNDNNGYYTYQIGLAWELEDQTVRPFTVTVFVEGSKLAKQIRSFRRGLWKSLGGAGIILAIAQLLFFALSLRPLQRVAEDVAKVESGERESLQGPYPIELEPLTRNLDRLMATEKANQARYRSALDSLAHSLKTPLAVIRAGLASENEAAAMANAVEEMQHLIASRLERAAASTRRTLSAPVPVQEQADRIIASLHKIYSHKLKTPDVIIPPGLNFFGEKRDLMEMMGNLLDNACKYGEGEVRLSAGAIEGNDNRPGFWMLVENDGEPIDPLMSDRLMQRGVRGDERVEGHGLGLTIVTELVSAYGGDIKVNLSELGGAAFKITIPPA
ncbi:MAG: two-component system sensor histidine kinase PhoQ [Lysobacterales bacterium]|jgi:two-component system sensor histidine kinase PhoQ